MNIVLEGELPWLLWAAFSLGQAMMVWALSSVLGVRLKPPSADPTKQKRRRSTKRKPPKK